MTAWGATGADWHYFYDITQLHLCFPESYLSTAVLMKLRAKFTPTGSDAGDLPKRGKGWENESLTFERRKTIHSDTPLGL